MVKRKGKNVITIYYYYKYKSEKSSMGSSALLPEMSALPNCRETKPNFRDRLLLQHRNVSVDRHFVCTVKVKAKTKPPFYFPHWPLNVYSSFCNK